ncbi:MAG: hypothetical protein ACK4HM_00635 [Thermosynechococcus sp.]
MPSLRPIWLCGLLLTTSVGFLSFDGSPAIERRREAPKVVRLTDTLVEWLSGDREYRSFQQMQVFPQ